MKNISFLFAGVLTTLLTLGITGCSDNADRTNPSTSNPTETGTGTSVGNELNDESNDHIVDPDASDTGAKGN